MKKILVKAFLKKQTSIIVNAFLIFIFLLPFIGLLINSLTGFEICKLYTFGIESTSDFFRIWVMGFGAIGVAYNIVINNKRLRHQQKQLENQQNQLEIQSKEERNGQYSKAIELLGNGSETVRIGAIHSLDYIAKEHPEEYYNVIFDLLCSHIRTTTSNPEYKKNHREEPSNEINTIFNILFDRKSHFAIKSNKANLKNSWLVGIKLLDFDLSGTIFFEVNLSNAWFDNCTFDGSIFMTTNFKNAYLNECTFRNAYIERYTTFESAKIYNSHFENSQILKTCFEDTKIANSKFECASFRKCSWFEAKISETSFDCSYFESSLFCKTLIDDSNFRGAFIYDNVFYDSAIISVNINGAFLSSCQFNGTEIRRSTIYGAKHYPNISKYKELFENNRTYFLRKHINNMTYVQNNLLFGKIEEQDISIIKHFIKACYINSDLKTQSILSSIFVTNESKLEDFTSGIFEEEEAKKIIKHIEEKVLPLKAKDSNKI